MTGPQFRGVEPLVQLAEIASRHHLARVLYRKSVTNTGITPRVVEAYNLTQGKQDPMVHCYQIEPEEGWRYFMIHKLESVEDTGRPFKPRRKVTLATGEVAPEYERDEAWTLPLRQYRNLVSDALADGSVTPEELLVIEGHVVSTGITPAQVRFVHASLYHRCLGAIIEDGEVDADEIAQIRFLHKVMARLGWSVGDRPRES